jgi:serine protease AprX
MPKNGLPGASAGRRIRLGGKQTRRVAALSTALAAALTGMAAAQVPAASASATEKVIVTANGLLSPVTAILEVGGSVLSSYHLINGVEATVLTAAVPLLSALPGITVTPDATVSVQSTVTPADDPPHTPSDSFLAETGASRLAGTGDTGQGVTVAVLDTGIDRLPDFAGRLAGGVDLTGANQPFGDNYGHGTFVAGLIAANGTSSGGQYSGEAPGAQLVSIKVAGAAGTTDLATLINGLQWAVDHQALYGIKVLNLSLGYKPTQSTVLNPLDQAVEAVWDAGITVVASAGNAGPFDGTVLSPGDDPLVITAGSVDDMGTPSVSDDQMTDFSSAGPTTPDGYAKPDLVTSGRSVVSLAAPGSAIDGSYPSAQVGAANFVGSGTSFSAAITSGAVALILADDPGLTPDQVKARLLASTQPGPAGNPFVDGHGILDAYAAATMPAVNLSQSVSGLLPSLLNAVVSLLPNGSADTWNPSLWSGVTWPQQPSNGWAWNGDHWNGSDWNGWAWNGWAWNGWAWNDAAWDGGAWNGWAWNGWAWNGSAWNGAAWNGSAWNSSAWS